MRTWRRARRAWSSWTSRTRCTRLCDELRRDSHYGAISGGKGAVLSHLGPDFRDFFPPTGISLQSPAAAELRRRAQPGDALVKVGPGLVKELKHGRLAVVGVRPRPRLKRAAVV